MPPKAEKKNNGFDRLRADLKAQTPQNVYLFYGEETYLRSYYLEELHRLLIPAGFEEFNYHRLSGKGLTVQELTEVTEAMPMMAQHTMVVVTDLDIFRLDEQQRTALMALLADFPEYCTLVLVYDLLPYKRDGKMKKLYKGQNAGKYSHIIAPTPDKITQMGIARTFQNIRLWKSQTVFENVLIAKHCRRSANLLSATFRLNADEEKRQREECEHLLQVLGLQDVRDELATGLPYGLQRRVEIARALATEPKLLMLDEPSLGLAPIVVREIFDIIRTVNQQGITVLLNEQNANMALKVADYAYVLETGNLTLSGTGAELLANEQVKAAYLGRKLTD